MKKILNALCFTLLAMSQYSYSLVDPDSLDPSMPVVSYLIPAADMKIESYRQGKPSHLSLILCPNCIEKTYKISDNAVLELSRAPLKKDQLTIQLMKKEFSKIRVGIDRTKQEIIYLRLNASANDELPEQEALKTNTSEEVIKL